MKALIVDDERLARKELMKLLEEHPSIEIVGEAQNADEAEQMITELNPDLLFLDIQMPGLSGLEIQEKLARTGVSIPIIFVTGQGDITMSVQAMKAGAVEFLTKPCGVELLEAIRQAIERLSNATMHLAELIMNSAISKALKDKRVREIQ